MVGWKITTIFLIESFRILLSPLDQLRVEGIWRLFQIFMLFKAICTVLVSNYFVLGCFTFSCNHSWVILGVHQKRPFYWIQFDPFWIKEQEVTQRFMFSWIRKGEKRFFWWKYSDGSDQYFFCSFSFPPKKKKQQNIHGVR